MAPKRMYVFFCNILRTLKNTEKNIQKEYQIVHVFLEPFFKEYLVKS